MKGRTRFERKILAAILAVAAAPLLATLFLGLGAVREAYQVGVNERVRAQLEGALEVYRAHLVALRRDAERTSDAVAFDYRLRDAVTSGDLDRVRRRLDRSLDRYPAVGRIVVRTAGGTVLARAERAERLDTGRTRLLTERRSLTGLSRDVEVVVTVGTPAAEFAHYQKAGQTAHDFVILEKSTDYISWRYLAVYLALLLVVIAIVVSIVVGLSRRVTRRVADLAAATARVGRGDLTVEVPTDARDEVGELTRAFNAMVRDLRESRERIDYLQRIGAWQEFARRLAHEIKNPLTPIQLAAQELHESYRGDDAVYRRKLEDARSIIEEEVATLRRLVGAFSAFAKLPEAALAPADLSDLLGDLERTVPAVLEDVGDEGAAVVDVRFERSESLPVRIDAIMLKRCVDNLLRNAVHAAWSAHPAGGGHVVVAARREGDVAVLEVRDDGPGVPLEERRRIFDPYFTTKPEGTGLGLAIVKKVVLEHAGEIEAEEAPEGGAALRIRLPLDHPGGPTIS